MFCKSCGRPIQENARFCEKCGTPVIGESNLNQNKTKKRSSVYFEKIKDFVDKLELSTFQKAVSIVASVSALIFLICVTGTVSSWIFVIAALLLTFLCVKKYGIATKWMAVSYTVFAAEFMWQHFVIIVRFLFLHESLHFNVMPVIIHLIIYGCALLYWLAVLGKFKTRSLASGIMLLGITIISMYEFINTFVIVRDGFRSAFCNLGLIAFLSVYAMLIFADKETVSYIKTLFSGCRGTVANDSLAGDKQYCPKCGCSLPMDASFCDNCGNPLNLQQNISAPSESMKSDSEKCSANQCADAVNVLPVSPVDENPADNTAANINPIQTDTSNTSDRFGSTFMALHEFIIDEKVSAFQFENSYKIYDMNGNIVGAVQQDTLSGGAKAAQVFGGNGTKSLQKFKLTVLSANGDKLGEIYRDGGALAPIFINSADGSVVAETKLRFGTLKDSNDKFICKFSFAGLTKYQLKDENGVVMAEINRKWNGAKSLFTTADKYLVALSPEISGSKRQIICSVALAYDMLAGDR